MILVCSSFDWGRVSGIGSFRGSCSATRTDADSAGRASELIKGLLGAYFNGSLDKYNLPGEQPATEAIDERVRAAKAKLLGIKFTDLE
jgi:hypothetical protein